MRFTDSRDSLRFLFVSIFASFLLLVSCSSKQKTLRPSEQTRQFAVSLVLSDSSFALGSKIDFSMIFENTSKDTLELVFPNTCRFDFVISRDGAEIWSLLAAKSCAQVISRNRLAPGAVMTLDSSWDGQTSLPEAKVLLGKHSVKGILRCSPPIETEEVEFYLTD